MADLATALQLALPVVTDDFYLDQIERLISGIPGQVWSPDKTLRDEPAIYDRIREDPELRTLIELRCALEVGAEWTVQPASEDDRDERTADVIRDLLDEVADLHSSLLLLVEKALLLGVGYARIHGEWRTARAAGQTRRWWVPTHLRDVDRSRLRLISPAPGAPPVWSFRNYDGTRWHPLGTGARWLVRLVRGRSEHRFGYGDGMNWSLYLTQFTIRELENLMKKGLDRWALGIVLGKVARRARIDGVTNAQVQAQLLNTIKTLRQHGVLIMDGEDELEVVQTNGTGHNMVLEAIQHLRERQRIALIGANLPTKAEGGSFAATDSQQDTVEALVGPGRKALYGCLTGSLVDLVWRQNAPAFDDLGWRGMRPVMAPVQQRQSKPLERAQTMAILASQLGMQFRREEAYELAGLTPPKHGTPEEDLVGAPAHALSDPFTVLAPEA